eukprot:1321327-Amorphochlora_amoeboformis.AAC.2
MRMGFYGQSEHASLRVAQRGLQVCRLSYLKVQGAVGILVCVFRSFSFFPSSRLSPARVTRFQVKECPDTWLTGRKIECIVEIEDLGAFGKDVRPAFNANATLSPRPRWGWTEGTGTETERTATTLRIHLRGTMTTTIVTTQVKQTYQHTNTPLIALYKESGPLYSAG